MDKIENYITLSLVSENKHAAFKIGTILLVVGVLMLLSILFIWDPEPGMPRYIAVGVSLVFMAFRFCVGFFIEEYEKMGLLKIHSHGITVKPKNSEVITFEREQIKNLSVQIKDYEGEAKAIDLVKPAGELSVRSGANNFLEWTYKDDVLNFQFKLRSAVEKRKLLAALTKFKTK